MVARALICERNSIYISSGIVRIQVQSQSILVYNPNIIERGIVEAGR
jgi:hypothetical protein